MIITFKGIDLSGWVFTDTTQLCACPRCGSELQKDCHTPKGRKARTPHLERVIEFSKLDLPKGIHQGRAAYDNVAAYCTTLGDDWSVRDS